MIIGAIVVVSTFLNTWLAMAGSKAGFFVALLELGAVGYCIYRFGRQRSGLYDAAAGYSYGQSMGFVLATMLCAGFIYGVGTYFLVNYVAPDYYHEMLEAVSGGMYGDRADEVMQNTLLMMKNPFAWVFNITIAMIILGGLIGAVVSAFLKRPPQRPVDNDPENE